MAFVTQYNDDIEHIFFRSNDKEEGVIKYDDINLILK